MVFHKEIEPALNSALSSFRQDITATSAVWDWISSYPVKPWFEGIGEPLKPLFKKLGSFLSKEALIHNGEYLEKALPRNTRVSKRCMQTLQTMMEIQHPVISKEDLKPWKDFSLSRYTTVLGNINDLNARAPRRMSASCGCTPVKGGYVVGEKGDHLLNLVSEARRLYSEAVSKDRYKWESLTLEVARDICKAQNIFHVPFFRHEPNIARPRLIWGSNAALYLIESVINDAVMSSPLFLSRRCKSDMDMRRFFDDHAGATFISADYSNYDQHGQFELMKEVYRWIGEFCNVPEPLMVFLAACNTAAPMVIPLQGGGFSTFWRDGMFCSGGGIFVGPQQWYALGLGSVALEGHINLNCRSIFASGDDHVIVGDDAEGYRRILQRYGMVLKGDSLERHKSFSLLKRWCSSTGEVMPIWASRLRNACCPVVTDPATYRKDSPHATAYRVRAALDDLVRYSIQFPRLEGLLDWWMKKVAPAQVKGKDLLCDDLTMPELAQYALIEDPTIQHLIDDNSFNF